MSVDLPAPFSPSSVCTSPRRRSKSILSLARTPGNCFVMPRSSRRGVSSTDGGPVGRLHGHPTGVCVYFTTASRVAGGSISPVFSFSFAAATAS
jgi:hypothetical protein